MNRLRIVVIAAALSATGCLCFGGAGPAAQGITSETHRQHVGGMVFASARIDHGAENPATFVDHCVLGQPCYGRFYLPKSLRDSANDRYASAFALRATVDGREISERNFAMLSWWSTYNFTLFRDSSDDEFWEHPKWFLGQVARRLPPGDHVLELEVLAVPRGQAHGAGEPIARGRITLTVPPNSRQIIARALARENQIMAEAQAQQERNEAAAQAESDRQAAEAASAPASDSTPSETQPQEAEPVADKPAEPSCLPDGAATDDWNKCCGKHWRGTSGAQFCCSEVGGGTDVKTACY